MSYIDDVIKRVLENEPSWIPCSDKRNQESVRVSVFNARKKLPKEYQDMLSIQKENREGKYFVKVSLRNVDTVYKLDESGELVPVKLYNTNPEVQRIASLMREDGVSEEEIQNYINSAKNG